MTRTQIALRRQVTDVAVLMPVADAIAFLRNQIKPILKLADAAESFGKGRDAPNFRPRGAREVRRAAQAFIEMKARVERAIEQRTAMLAGVSHDTIAKVKVIAARKRGRTQRRVIRCLITLFMQTGVVRNTRLCRLLHKLLRSALKQGSSATFGRYQIRTARKHRSARIRISAASILTGWPSSADGGEPIAHDRSGSPPSPLGDS